MREHQTGNAENFVYTVDRKNHFVYLNENLRKRCPDLKVGDTRQEIFTEEDIRRGFVYLKKLQQWMSVSAAEIEWPGEGICTIVIMTPVKSEMYSAHKTYDSLTGLISRAGFVSKAAERVKKDAPDRWCLVAIDIEHFKLFNEWYGQNRGDILLHSIGTYLRQMQTNHPCIAGYFGNDDFYVLIPNDKDAINSLYQGMLEEIAEFGEHTDFLPVFGVYKIYNPLLSMETMCSRAQMAAAHIKDSYEQRIFWYDQEMTDRLEQEQKLLNRISKGIDNGEFISYFQPKCEIHTGKVVSFEALTRWKQEDEVVSPGRYITMMERRGLITKMDICVWEEVCKVISRWRNQGLPLLPVSINVSIVDIKTMDVPAYLRELTEKYQIPHDLLSVEITESAFAQNYEVVKRFIDALHEMDFLVYMDDFGSGYSSLNVLKDMNMDVLKIDMKFLELNADNREKGIKILESVIKMSHMMKIHVVAEGVETKDHVDLLTNMDCTCVQGYYFYRPMSEEAVTEMLKRPGKLEL